MEGKEVRFGVSLSALFAVITTAASCGAVNAMHDSFLPLGGMIPLSAISFGVFCRLAPSAVAIAAESGVDDFLAQATPESKLQLIRDEQAKGKLVAMCGDGTNDAPALAQADVGVAMQTGTMAAREAGNMVDLDSDPTKLIEMLASASSC
jgi:hypothetical protein